MLIESISVHRENLTSNCATCQQEELTQQYINISTPLFRNHMTAGILSKQELFYQFIIAGLRCNSATCVLIIYHLNMIRTGLYIWVSLYTVGLLCWFVIHSVCFTSLQCSKAMPYCDNHGLWPQFSFDL